MKTLSEYLLETKETYTIKGVKVKEGEPIWIDKDGKPILVTFDAIYGSKLIYVLEDDYGKEKLYNTSTDSFIETNKMAIKRQKSELSKGKSKPNIEKLKRQLLELEQELEELNSEMENDPDILAELEKGGGKATDEYGRRQNKLYDKIDKLRAKINESLDENAGGTPSPSPTPGPGSEPGPKPGPGMPPPPGRPGPMFGGHNHRPIGLRAFIGKKMADGMSYDSLVDWCHTNGMLKSKPEEQLTKEQAKDMAKDVYAHIQKASNEDSPRITISNVKAAVDALEKWERRD